MDICPVPHSRLPFLGLLIIQGLYQAEQTVQVFQRFVLEIQEAKGLLGHLFDQEPLQFCLQRSVLDSPSVCLFAERRPSPTDLDARDDHVVASHDRGDHSGL